MNKKSIILLLGFALLLIYSFKIENNNNKGNNNDKNTASFHDTIPAYVMYGNNFLFDSIENFDTHSILEYRDSLITRGLATPIFLNQINLFVKIERMTKPEIISLIDSLFEENHIPYPLINQINFYVASHPDIAEKHVVIIEEDTSFYPANKYYNSWTTNNPNPYSVNLSKNDTIITLVLNGRGKSDGFEMPMVNTLTSQFGWREGRPHKGIDIDLEVWDTVRVAFSGKVRVAQVYGGYGRVVVVRHYNGLETLYAHLHRLKVKPGQEVKAGDLIGLGGSSGHSTGSHLHFECRFKGVPINPLSFITYDNNKLKNSRLVNDTLILKKTEFGYASFPKGTKFYEVKRGDSLYEIAKAFGTTTTALAKINGIKRNTMLIVGQTLRVI